jgi:hypothetical protein
MKMHERRESLAFPYFKLAVWDPRSFTWKDGKVAFASHADAIRAARKPGRYRISEVGESGRIDMEPFAA